MKRAVRPFSAIALFAALTVAAAGCHKKVPAPAPRAASAAAGRSRAAAAAAAAARSGTRAGARAAQ